MTDKENKQIIKDGETIEISTIEEVCSKRCGFQPIYEPYRTTNRTTGVEYITSHPVYRKELAEKGIIPMKPYFY